MAKPFLRFATQLSITATGLEAGVLQTRRSVEGRTLHHPERVAFLLDPRDYTSLGR